MLRHGLTIALLVITGATDLVAQRLTRPALAAPIHPVVLPTAVGITFAGQAPHVTITWQPVPGAVDYVVFRTNNPAQPGSPVGAGPVVTPSLVDQTAAPGTVYYYLVQARFSGGQSTVSTPVQFDSPPAVFVKSAVGNRSVATMTRSAPPPPPAPAYLPAITGVSDTAVAAGPTATIIRGRNLSEVTGVYFGTGTPGSDSNPLMPATVITDDMITFVVNSPCFFHGVLMLEQSSYPDQFRYITQNGPPSSQIRMYCAAAPVVGNVLNKIRSGGTMVVPGNNLSWVTQVTYNGPLSFHVVSDHQIEITVPQYSIQQSTQGTATNRPTLVTMGTAMIAPTLVSRFGSVTMTPTIFNLPPFVTVASGPRLPDGSPTPAEPGGTLIIDGYALGKTGYLQVTIDGRPAVVTSEAVVSLSVTVPAGTATGTFQITNDGGSTAGTFDLLTGPSSISAVSPANAPVGSRVTLTGQNLSRARGVCFTPVAAGAPLPMQLMFPGLGTLGINNSIAVDVPTGTGPGPLGLYLPTQPNGTTYACEMGRVTLQVP